MYVTVSQALWMPTKRRISEKKPTPKSASVWLIVSVMPETRRVAYATNGSTQ
jgi:hypothetical protein